MTEPAGYAEDNLDGTWDVFFLLKVDEDAPVVDEDGSGGYINLSFKFFDTATE